MREVHLPRPRVLIGILFGTATVLVVLSWLSRAVPYEFVSVHLSIDVEQSVPTWYSVVQLFVLAVAATLAAAGSRQRPERRSLLAAASVALFFSIDEQATIHESLTAALPEVFPRIRERGAWVFVYLLLLVVLLLWLWRDVTWMWAHRRRLLVRGSAGAALFAIGAVGLEVVQYLTGFPDLLTHIEELLEMTGVSVALWALYAEVWPVTVVLGRPRTASR